MNRYTANVKWTLRREVREAEKWVRVGNWGDAADAKRIVLEAIERYDADKAVQPTDAGLRASA